MRQLGGSGVDQVDCGTSGMGEGWQSLQSAVVMHAEGLGTKHRFDHEGDGVSAGGLRMRKRTVLAALEWIKRGYAFQMWTGTYDHKMVAGGLYPDRQWESLTQAERDDVCRRVDVLGKKERHVAEFVRSLREELGGDWHYAGFKEFQERGMPHFHILLFWKGQGTAAVRSWAGGKLYIDHRIVYRLWGRGAMTFSPDKNSSIARAAAYATKYVVKGTRLPEWVADDVVCRTVRLVGCSRGFWDVLEETGPGRKEADEGSPAARPLRGAERTVGEVRRDPGQFREVMLKLQGCDGNGVELEKVVRVHMDMAICVDRMGELGFLGGACEVPGRVSFSAIGGGVQFGALAETLLVSSSHCGEHTACDGVPRGS